MSAPYPSNSPVENAPSISRPQSYQSPPPRFYGPPKISTPQLDSLQPIPLTAYRHSHSFSIAHTNRSQHGQQSVSMRERSSSHSLYPVPYHSGGSSAVSSSRRSSPSRGGAYPGAPPQPQNRSRSSSISPHPMQLQPGSQPSSRPHSPSLSFTGSDELHLGAENTASSSRRASPPASLRSGSALPPAQQLSPPSQDAGNGLPDSRERSASSSSANAYAPRPQKLQKHPPQGLLPGPIYLQHSQIPVFNDNVPNRPPPPPINTSFHDPPPLRYPSPGPETRYSPPGGSPRDSNSIPRFYSMASPPQDPKRTLPPAMAIIRP